MTRFARAKGSKSSNERLPEEATSWQEMKQQLLEKNKEIAESKNKQAAIEQRQANYKAFLEEKEEEERKKSVWADFPQENRNSTSHAKSRSHFNNTLEEDDESDDEVFSALKAKVDKVLEQSANKQNDDDSDAPPEEHSSKVQVEPKPDIKVKKVKKKKLSILLNNESNEKISNSSKEQENADGKNKQVENEELLETEKGNNTIVEQGKKQKKRKLEVGQDGENRTKKQKKEIDINIKDKPNKKGKQKGNLPKKVIKENLTEKDLKKIEKKKQKRLKQLEKKKKSKEELKKQKQEEEKAKKENGESSETPGTGIEATGEKVEPAKAKTNTPKQGKFEKPHTFDKKFDKNKKPRDNKDHARKKPFMPTKMFINGKEVEVDYVDGFPVKKEDAERLKKLRREMISKGLPRSEINISLKLERRKAEKAFAREKKKVCFNCRKSGHNLSECPEIGKDQLAVQGGSGICYKCGSTEHTHFECKVVRGQDFNYAQCFICNEQGHIARQCPDNARGLYPKGGSCKVCGDVTHLKKDCPKYQAQQQQIQNSLSIETIGDGNPDSLDERNQFSGNSLGNRRPNKIVKF